MIPAEVEPVLTYFTEAWPWAEVGEMTFDVWAEQLMGVDAQDAHTAARKCVRTLDRPPSVARFLQECRNVQRSHIPELGHPVAFDKETSARVARALAAGFRAAAKDIPSHDHRNGWEQCPCCSTSGERDSAAEVMGAIREALREGDLA